MSNPVSTKVHTHIDHVRSLCGRRPKDGKSRIVALQNFFTAEEKCQCKKCLEHLKERGYNIEKLRHQFRSIYDRAQELALIP